MHTVSVITPLLNRAAMLPQALQSVAAQGVNVEHIVVDGGSTDGAPEIARAAGAQVFDLAGSSIYEALNFGIGRATGSLLFLLNSDDRLAPGAIAAAQAKFEDDPTLELVRGRVSIDDAERGSETDEPRARPLTLHNALLHASNINACALTKALYERVGPFEARYRISADRHWLARALIANARRAEAPEVLYVYRQHAGSLTIGPKKLATKVWVDEHLEWSRMLLKDRTLSAVDRAALRRFHAKELAHLTTLNLKRGDIGAGLRAISDGFQHDVAWPLHAVSPVSAIVARRAGDAMQRR